MRPRLIVTAGPSGSGKSVGFPREFFESQGVDYFNIDERVKELNGGLSQLIPQEYRDQANRELREFADRHIAAKQSFAFETTLRSDFAIRISIGARQAGFDSELHYVAPSSVEVNIERVLKRADEGGHSAPEWKIREIHHDSIHNLPEAIRQFTSVEVIDNTELRRMAVSLVTQDGRITFIAPQVPQWLEDVLSNTEYKLSNVRQELYGGQGHGFGF